jgi:outer membrane protein assembly factor BamB
MNFSHFFQKLYKFSPPVILLLGIVALAWWLFFNPTQSFVTSEPGKDGFAEAGAMEEDILIGEHFEQFAATQTTFQEIWPRFRGEYSDNIYRSGIPLINSFGGQAPEILWSVEMGEGHAGAAIYEGLVYVLDYDENLRADMLRCFVLDTGEEVWRRWYNVHVRRNHGMSRTVPAVTEDYILTMGPRGHIMCVDRKTGDFLWGIDLVEEYNTEIPLWYTGQCPLIVDGVAIIAPGGDALMIGVDCTTGEVLWETPNPGDWKMSHSSVMPFEFGGRKMFVYSASGGVAGVAADGPDIGTILWQSSLWNHPVVAASPVCMPDGKIFLTAGYGAGSMLLQLTENNGQFDVEILKTFRPGEGMSSEQQTPILVDGYMFGVLPKDARTLRNQFVCVRPEDPTDVVWASGPTARFGLGPFILADGKFFLLDDDATLVIIEKSTSGYVELDRVKLFDGHDAWAPLAIADGYMVLRDADRMICINIRQHLNL